MNNFGAQLYSDGRQIGPMCREWPSITKCNKCHSYFWIKDANIIDEDFKNDSLKEAWENADSVESLNIDDLFKCLQSYSIRNGKEEGFIRHRIWWAYNDRIRERKAIFVDKEDENNWQENLLRFIDLINNDQYKCDLILQAELMRNRGLFKECLLILDLIEDKSLSWVKDKLREQCNKQNKLVFILRW